MRVLVTGAAGFIGSKVARDLRARGHDVVAADLMLPQAHGQGAPPPDVRVADVRDKPAVLALLDGVDVVSHQAAMVGAGVDTSDIPLYASHNDVGTAVLLAAMAERDVSRLVLASSMVVYGEGRYACPEHGPQPAPPRRLDDLQRGQFDLRCPRCGGPLGWQPVDEDTAALDPRSSYAASKVAQEHYVAAWCRQAPAVAVALRYHNVYGAGMPQDSPYSGVAAKFRSALERGEPPEVFEDGRQMRDFVHVDDVAAANALAVDAVLAMSAEAFDAFNVCSGSPISIGDVAGRLCDAVSVLSPQISGRFRPGDVRHVVASPDKAERVLGFAATTSPDVGLHRFATEPLRD